MCNARCGLPGPAGVVFGVNRAHMTVTLERPLKQLRSIRDLPSTRAARACASCVDKDT
jgi:hypothetical protein